MRGLACSAEFMRRFAHLAQQAGWAPGLGKRGLKKHTVESLVHSYCMTKPQVYRLLKALELRPRCDIALNGGREPHPSLLVEASAAGEAAAPALVKRAVEEGLTAAQVRQEVRRLRVEQTPPLPAGQYDVLLADPPWRYDNTMNGHGGAEDHYPTLSLEEIAALPVRELVAADATLFLWVTAPFALDVRGVLDAWGFTYKTQIVWVKGGGRLGIGHYVRGDHELLYVCTRGAHVPLQRDAVVSSVLQAPRREHSRKPDVAYQIIERLYPQARRLELFARTARPGWTAWGNEPGRFAAQSASPVRGEDAR